MWQVKIFIYRFGPEKSANQKLGDFGGCKMYIGLGFSLCFHKLNKMSGYIFDKKTTVRNICNYFNKTEIWITAENHIPMPTDLYLGFDLMWWYVSLKINLTYRLHKFKPLPMDYFQISILWSIFIILGGKQSQYGISLSSSQSY